METGDRGTGGPGDRVLRASVVSPERVLFEGEVTSVVAPLYDGLAGILPRHAPMLALLGTGPLAVAGAEGVRRFRVAGGFIQVRSDVVRVAAEQAEELGGSG